MFGMTTTATTTVLGVLLSLALTIVGRRLREEAFRALPMEQKIEVVDKLHNYTSTELIPFTALFAGLVGVGALRPEWMTVAFAVFVLLIVPLVAVFHVRTRHRFRELGLSAAFLSQYEQSRWVSYSAVCGGLLGLRTGHYVASRPR
jgi:hypothetical protein